MSFSNKTVLITGASRGIGKAIAIKLAEDGANIIVVAKTVEIDPRIEGTIHSAAAEVEKAGGKALALQCDIRFEEQINSVVNEAVKKFGGIDVLINNASAIDLHTTEELTTKKFDLMNDINVRGTFLMTKACLPQLKQAANPHILTMSPPLNITANWFGNHVAYTIAKYSMSMMTLGWAEEFKKYKIAVNSLWPKTTIATAAVKNIIGGDALMKMSRKPAIVADAAYSILKRPAGQCTGNFFIDEETLAAEGINDFDKYAVTPGGKLFRDLFVN